MFLSKSELRSVTWTELLFVADHFGMDGLRNMCQKQAVESTEDSNVVKLLLEVGCAFEEVKVSALCYIAGNSDYMFG